MAKMYVTVVEFLDEDTDYKVFQRREDAEKRFDIAHSSIYKGTVKRTKGGSSFVNHAKLWQVDAVDAYEAKQKALAGEGELLLDGEMML